MAAGRQAKVPAAVKAAANVPSVQSVHLLSHAAKAKKLLLSKAAVTLPKKKAASRTSTAKTLTAKL